MRNPIDPVDRVLESLKGRAWPANCFNPELERQLMRNIAMQKPVSFLARHRVLVPALVLLLVAGVGFAAGGGIEWIRSWFLTVTVNGTVVHAGEVVTDPNGQASFTVPIPPSSGGSTTLSVTATGTPVPEGTTVNVSVAPDGEQATVTITPAEEPK